MHNEQDDSYMNRCILLAKKSMADGDLPFGALIVQNGAIIAEAQNTGLTDVTGHAEINAVKMAFNASPDIDFSTCTLYTNFEPCAMCSFIIRDFGIGRVVFAAESPHLGGRSRWDILTNDQLSPKFTSRDSARPPQITSGVLRETVATMFDELAWKMHRYDA